MSLTFTDLFCGAGGASAGLEAAGLTLQLGANHWDRAIETHAANFPHAEHLHADINHVDMRRLPGSDILWASVICTEASPANGVAKSNVAWQQRTLEESTGDHVPQPAFERTRACALDVVRATEVHGYKAVVVENVTNFITKWALFDWWFSGMEQVGRGYHGQIVNVSSAHVWDETNDPAPQWRDRVYIVFTRKDVPIPDLAPRPISRCLPCGQDVRAMQWWKNPKKRRVGAYGRQYLYRCPNRECGHAIVEPFVAPAAVAIDWTDLGVRIGDRPLKKFKDKKSGTVTTGHLAPPTMRRVRVGFEMFGQPTVVAAHGNTWEAPGSGYARAWPALEAPMTSRTGTPGDGLGIPAALVPAGGTWNDDPRLVDEPMRARLTREAEGLLTDGSFVLVNRANNRQRGVDEPLPPMLTGGTLGLVRPPSYVVAVNHGEGDGVRAYDPQERPLSPALTKIGDAVVVPAFVAELRGGGSDARPVEHPLATVTTARHHGLTVPDGAFLQKHHGGLDYEPIEHMLKSPHEPLATVVGKPNISLVIPFRRGATPHPAGRQPLSTVTTREAHAVCTVTDEDLLNARFRMLKPREHLRAQRFDDGYIVLGNQGEQTMLAGNAVSCNAAQWLGGRLLLVLGGAA